MAKATKARRTKIEVEQEFAALEEDLAEEKLTTSSKEALSERLKEAEIRNAVSGIAVEVVIRKLADLNTEISKTIAHLSEKLVAEVNLLNQVKNAVGLEQAQLEKLHKIDVAATSLDQLI